VNAGRLIVFGLGAVALAIALLLGVGGLPPVGDYRGPYGDVVYAIAGPERHAANAVGALVFDIRAFDTLLEEFILFGSVTGVAVLLRPTRRKGDGSAARTIADAADRLVVFLLVGIGVTFGFYVVVHGQITPGGGFQGGAFLASIPLLVYLAGGPGVLYRIVPRGLVAGAGAAGALLFAAIGLLGLAAGGAYFENVIPFGPRKSSIVSGGIIPLLSLASGLEVGAGFARLIRVFLEERLRP